MELAVWKRESTHWAEVVPIEKTTDLMAKPVEIGEINNVRHG